MAALTCLDANAPSLETTSGQQPQQQQRQQNQQQHNLISAAAAAAAAAAAEAVAATPTATGMTTADDEADHGLYSRAEIGGIDLNFRAEAEAGAGSDCAGLQTSSEAMTTSVVNASTEMTSSAPGGEMKIPTVADLDDDGVRYE